MDLKSFDDAFYRKLCGARLAPVLDSIVAMRQAGIWLELTTLVIPGHNDDDGELRALTGWIVETLGPETPWHVSRFFPAYRLLDVPPTPLTTLRRVADLGREAGLAHVYVGNAPELGLEDTCCAGCGRVVIERRGYRDTQPSDGPGGLRRLRARARWCRPGRRAGGRADPLRLRRSMHWSVRRAGRGRCLLPRRAEPARARWSGASLPRRRTAALDWPHRLGLLVPHAGLVYSGVVRGHVHGACRDGLAGRAGRRSSSSARTMARAGSTASRLGDRGVADAAR